MKRLLIIFITTLATFKVVGQTKTIDSLKQLITPKKDTVKVLLLEKIGLAFLRIRMDSSLRYKDSGLHYYQDALDLAQKLNFVSGEMECREIICEVLYRTGNYPRALQFSLEYMKRAENLRDTLNLFWSMRSVLMTYEYLPNESHHVLKLAEAIRALIHSGFFKDEKQLALFELIGYVNHAKTYYETAGQLDSVLYFSQRSYEIASRLQDDQLIALATGSLADINYKLKNIDVALSYYKMSAEASRKSGRFDQLAYVEIMIATIFQEKSQIDSAFLYAHQSLINLKKVTDPLTRMSVYSQLSELYKHNNKFDSAYKYLDLNVTIKDSLYSQQKTNSIESLIYGEQLRQQELEQKKIRDAEERKLNLQYAAIALGLIGFMLVFFLLSHSIIVNQRFIRFIGIIGLLVLFEFINLFIHPYLGNFTNHSPLLMLLIMVVIAAMLVPVHHFLQGWISEKLVEKNKKIRLVAAKRTIEKLEKTSES